MGPASQVLEALGGWTREQGGEVGRRGPRRPQRPVDVGHTGGVDEAPQPGDVGGDHIGCRGARRHAVGT